MDFSKFSDPKFDAKEWVNGALRTHKEAQTSVDVSGSCCWGRRGGLPRYQGCKLSCICACSLQAHASTLVMKLQLFIQVTRPPPSCCSKLSLRIS